MKSVLTSLLILLAGITFSQNDSIKIEITNAVKGFNFPFSDFTPVISAEGSVMILTSRTPYTENEKKKNKEVLETNYSSEYDWRLDKWADAKKYQKTELKPFKQLKETILFTF